MEENYQNHIIRAGAAPVRLGDGWKPVVQVNWKDGGRDCVKLWMEWYFASGFSAYEEAENEGNLFAKRWIDEQQAESRLDTIRTFLTNLLRPASQ
jgi:hypothetical protein